MLLITKSPARGNDLDDIIDTMGLLAGAHAAMLLMCSIASLIIQGANVSDH
jgi:hypothetical protein